MLTFDEFLAITPCTDGKHSTTDLPPQVEKKSQEVDPALLAVTSAAPTPGAASEPPPRAPIAAPQTPAGPTPPPPESEDDDPGLEIPDGAVCRRKTCGAKHARGTARDGEKCTHHPGVPVFHEGSKGYSCCKRRVLEFDQFLKIEGCKTKDRHLFVGSGADKKGRDDGGAKSTGVAGGEELLETVRYVSRLVPCRVSCRIRSSCPAWTCTAS